MTDNTPAQRINATRNRVAVGVAGGATTVIDLGRYRFVSDPTFDPPGKFGYLQRSEAAKVSPSEIGPVDVALISHDLHADNLDVSGRDFALRAPVALAPRTSARRLQGRTVGISAWESWTGNNEDVTVTAVPARHGPADGELNDEGFVNCEVVGFVLDVVGAPRTYVSGDNASVGLVSEIRERFGSIDIAVLHGGGASVPQRFNGRPMSLTPERLVAAAEVLGTRHVIVSHETGWDHFVHGPRDTASAFRAAGLSGSLRQAPPGFWALRDDC